MHGMRVGSSSACCSNQPSTVSVQKITATRISIRVCDSQSLCLPASSSLLCAFHSCSLALVLTRTLAPQQLQEVRAQLEEETAERQRLETKLHELHITHDTVKSATTREITALKDTLQSMIALKAEADAELDKARRTEER